MKRHRGPEGHRRARILALCLTAAACGRDREATPPPAAPAAEAKYVGGDACRPCHAEIWSTYERTGMGRSWYPMSEAPVIEDWTKNNSFVVPATGLRYTMTRRNGKFYARQSIDDGRGGQTAVDERELVWAVGSANHSRQYLIVQDGKLFQAPVCWHTQNPVWDLCPGYEFDNFYFSRETGPQCVSCHNDPMTLVPGTRNNAFADPIPHGISCERCHGPGEHHVAKWDHGATPTGEADPTIVNPRRLSPDLRMQVCFRCHLGDSKASERVSLYKDALEEWRPGRPITTAVIPYRFVEKTVHDFGLSGQADRMFMSRCFTESGGRLECLSCHNPHKTIFRDDLPEDYFKTKCLECHEVASCTGPAAARAATKPADDCVSCHMRRGEPDDQRHVLYTDHWIRARIDDPKVARSRFDVEPFFPEALGALSPAERSFYMARAISLRTHVVPKAVGRQMWPQAEAKFREALDLGFDRAEGPYFLGLALGEQGKHGEAAQAFAAAYAKSPQDFDIAFAHGQSLMRHERIDEAVRVFTALAAAHPDAAGPLAELGRARVGVNDLAGALELFQKAVALEPWNAALRANTASMLSALERHPEAIAAAREALRLDPEGARTWDTYAMLLSRAGRAKDAEQAAARARTLGKAPGQRLSNVRAM
jgi:cytochrome c-type biogenesis protein CcmH/NrfG